MDKNSSSSKSTTPLEAEKSTADPVVPEVSAEAAEKEGEGLSAQAALRSASGASTHPTG